MTPENETELSEAVQGAAGPLRVVGGGTRPVGHDVVGEVLSTSGMSGIVDYEPGALTLVAGAGTPVQEIEAALAAEKQRLAFEPMDYRALMGTTGTPTIGGVVAANVSGPRRISVGACRDFLLGVRFVDGTGRVLKNGGRVMKNVTGYDLVKLMAGSRGTLGVLSEVSLKVLPVPETEATLILHGQEAGEAVAAMSAALGSPYEVTGAAYLPQVAGESPDVMLRLEGFEASVAYRLGALEAVLSSYGDMSVVRGDASREAWSRVRDVEMFAAGDGDVWRISLKPSDAPDILERMGEDVRVQLDWGGGLIWAMGTAGQDLRARLEPFRGHATLMRASAQTRGAIAVFQPEPAPLGKISQGLRDKFDPRGILNPGLMGRLL
ncbi:glycolate oxidase subunit GlcE [Rhodobacteraceae bacterium D3-12]|nr:glycolate oxidase subunit GlcE [Rhodobacteraceae bacterium D3-12]